MAEFTERVKLLIETVTDKASGDLGNLKTKVGETEGAFAKLKVGTGEAVTALGGMGTVATAGVGAAATALVGFGLKAVSSFQDTAQSVLHFQEVTGATADASSRFVAVAQAAGVSADDLSSAVGRLAKTVGATPEKLEKLGVAIAHTKDGATDLPATFVNVIQAMNDTVDPAERAALAQAAFGKSWQTIVKLIDENAGDVAAQLKAVSDFQIFSDSDLKSSEDYRKSIEDLDKTTQGLERELGQALVPVLIDAANDLTILAEAGVEAGDAIGGIREAAKKASEGHSFLDQLIAGTRDLFGAQINDEVQARKTADAHKDQAAALDFNTVAAQGLADQVTQTTDDMKRFTAGQQVAGVVLDANTIAMGAAGDEMSHQTTLLQAQAVAYDSTTIAAGAAGAEFDDLTKKTKDAEQAAKDHVTALQAEAQALTAEVDAAFSAADSHFALQKATDDYAQALDDLQGKIATENKSKDDTSTKQRTINGLYEEGAQKAKDVADAAVRVADDQAKANGTTLTAADRVSTWNGTMVNAASFARGPMRDAIVNYIAAVNGIPPEKVSQILASTPNLDEQKAKLDDASKTRDTAIKADDAGTAAATAKRLDNAAKPRTSTITAQTTGIQKAEQDLDNVSRNRQSTIFVTTAGTKFGMAGIPYAEGGQYVVGEAGPELVTLPRGAHVDSAGVTSMMLAGAAPSTTNVFVNVNVPPTVNLADIGKNIADALDAFYRRSGYRGRPAA